MERSSGQKQKHRVFTVYMKVWKEWHPLSLGHCLLCSSRLPLFCCRTIVFMASSSIKCMWRVKVFDGGEVARMVGCISPILMERSKHGEEGLILKESRKKWQGGGDTGLWAENVWHSSVIKQFLHGLTTSALWKWCSLKIHHVPDFVIYL